MISRPENYMYMQYALEGVNNKYGKPLEFCLIACLL